MPHRSNLWKLLPAAMTGIAVGAILRLEPTNFTPFNADWLYTWQFATDHALEYGIVAFAALFYAYWFQASIASILNVASNAMVNALGFPPLAQVYTFTVQGGKMVISKWWQDVGDLFRAEGHQEGHQEGQQEGQQKGRQQGILQTLRLTFPDASETEIQRRYHEILASFDPPIDPEQ